MKPRQLTPLERSRLVQLLEDDKRKKDRVITLFFCVAAIGLIAGAVWAVLRILG